MSFKTDSDDMFATKLLSTVFGETPVSKLFMNVREKLSLCYYCACRYTYSKGSIMVDIGVERENIEKAKAEILRQLDEIKQGNITDADIESALLSLDNALTQIGDTPSSYVAVYEATPLHPIEPTDLYEIDASANLGGSRKVLLNGTIFILRGDHIYTLQGQQVK